MYRELHDALSRAIEAVRARDRLRAQRDLLAGRLATETTRHAELHARLDAELEDVARLEGLSLSRLLASITGRLEATLDEERRQADAAELGFVEQGQLVTALTTELAELDRRIAELGDVDALHARALKAKARMLVARGDDHGRVVVALAERLAQAGAMVRELHEALEHGNATLATLDEAAETLSEALRDGAWDIWVGGVFATAEKRATLDRASHHMRIGALRFERFRKELADVGRGIAAHAPFLDAGASGSSIERVLDYVFRGLVDAQIQWRIRRVAQGVAAVRHDVRQSLEELAHALAEHQRAWNELRTQLEAAIAAG